MPWKIMLLMGFFAFVRHHRIECLPWRVRPHSSPGTFIVAVLVVIGVLVQRDKFDFNVLCRIALPLTVVALFSIPCSVLPTTCSAGIAWQVATPRLPS